MNKQWKQVSGVVIVLAALSMSSSASADMFVEGEFSGGVSTNFLQIGLVSGGGSGSAVVAGPLGVSVGSVQLGGDGVVIGGGTSQFMTQASVSQNGWRVQTAAGAGSMVQTSWGGAGQAVSAALANFQRF